jgi:vancomycin aglycone glucosyltransferase
MRVLLSTYGTRGDVEPLAGLAVRLRELGAEVRMCAPPDEDLTELLARADVPLVPFGRPWRSWKRPTTIQERLNRVAEFISAQYDTLAAAAQGCDLLVATGMSHFVARSVADKAAIPHLFVVFCPILLDDTNSWNEQVAVPINAHRASIGLPPVDDLQDFMFTDHPWVAADPTLSPWQAPAHLSVVRTGAWILPDQRSLPAELVAFLDAGTPPVYVGFGSMAMLESKDIARVAIEAIRGQGRRVLIASGWAGLAPIDDRDDCIAVGEVNNQALFGHVAAVVHHGGAGTTMTAARAGAPQVVIPQVADQPYWAARVTDLGIGVAHDGLAPSNESLSAALKTALNPLTHARAIAVAAAIRTDGAAMAAQQLLDTISRNRQPAPVPTSQ